MHHYLKIQLLMLWYRLKLYSKKYGYTLNTPWNKIDKNIQEYLINGSGEERFDYSYVNMYDEYKEYFSPFEGVMPMLERRYKETNSDIMRESYEAYMSTTLLLRFRLTDVLWQSYEELS